MEISLPHEHYFKDVKLTALVEKLIQCSNELEVRSLKEEFYRRFQVRFFDRCHKIGYKLYKNFPDWEATRDDVFQETFITAFEIIQKFNNPKNWDDKGCEKVMLKWLSTIANNKFLNRIKTEKKEKENLDKYLLDFFQENSSGTFGKRKHYQLTYDKVKFDQVWLKLNPMSKEILFLSLEHDTLAADNEKHFPDHILNYLNVKYGAAKSTIRQAKYRALKAINSCKIEQ